jgi:hypothetical protein
MALPMILIGLLRLRSPDVTEKAVSWYGCQRALCIKAALTVDRSVIGRFLHSSYWPTILGTDSAATFSANRATVFMACFRLFMVALIAVAAIVTPFGLYESIETSPDSAHLHDRAPPVLGAGSADIGSPMRARTLRTNCLISQMRQARSSRPTPGMIQRYHRQF